MRGVCQAPPPAVTVRAIEKKRWPSGVSTTWVTTRPGVWKAPCKFQRGQVPPGDEAGEPGAAHQQPVDGIIGHAQHVEAPAVGHVD